MTPPPSSPRIPSPLSTDLLLYHHTSSSSLPEEVGVRIRNDKQQQQTTTNSNRLDSIFANERNEYRGKQQISHSRRKSASDHEMSSDHIKLLFSTTQYSDNQSSQNHGSENALNEYSDQQGQYQPHILEKGKHRSDAQMRPYPYHVEKTRSDQDSQYEDRASTGIYNNIQIPRPTSTPIPHSMNETSYSLPNTANLASSDRLAPNSLPGTSKAPAQDEDLDDASRGYRENRNSSPSQDQFSSNTNKQPINFELLQRYLNEEKGVANRGTSYGGNTRGGTGPLVGGKHGTTMGPLNDYEKIKVIIIDV